MDLKYLQTFLTVVSQGGFSKAAEKLHYTQSTITFQIGQLEQELSTTLFEKIGRRMTLTNAGQELIPYVQNVLRSVEQLRDFDTALQACRGELRVGVGESLLCYRMPGILKEFHRQAPGARLFLQSMNCYDIRDALLDGTLDLGLFYQNVGGYGTSLTAYPFGEYPVALVASPTLLQAGLDFRQSDQHIPLPFIINEPCCIFRQIFEQYLRERSIQLDHTIELWSIPTIKNLVKSEMGVSFLPVFTVQEELDRGELVVLPTELDRPQIEAVCAHHKNKWLSPLMQLFLSLCAQQP